MAARTTMQTGVLAAILVVVLSSGGEGVGGCVDC